MQNIKIENITDSKLREVYIDLIPKKLLEINQLKLMQEKLKKCEKELQIMVEAVGEYENEYFKIFTQIEKKTSVNYIELEQALQEVQKMLNESKECINEEQMETFTKLQASLKKDIEVKKPADKLKMLQSLSPAKAEEIKIVKETQKMVLKEKKSLLEDLQEENNSDRKVS